MDAWVNSATSAIAGSNLSTVLNYSDPLLTKILAAKKALQVSESSLLSAGITTENVSQLSAAGAQFAQSNKPLIELLIASCDGDLVTLESMTRAKPELVNYRYPSDDNGVTALIYAICFNNYAVAETLLAHHDADPDLPDTIVNYTPLMWAVYFNQLDMAKLLLNHQADPSNSPKDDGKNAIALVNHENLEMYNYFKLHNLLDTTQNDNEEDYFRDSNFSYDEPEDELAEKLKLQTISGYVPDQEEENDHVLDEEDETVLAADSALVLLREFDYETLLPEQYIKFSDSDIPSLLNYIFDIRIKNLHLQHDSKIPAAIVFQLVRYSALKVESASLSEFFFESFIARLRAVTNTKSGAFNMALQETGTNIGGAGDIVLLSYWLSSIQYLHYYFIKSEIYSKYPKFLQELINMVQSLIATLSFSINSRLTPLVDECLLDFTSLVDVSNVLYAKDWNLFKKNKKHPSTYDDIFDMLYPPSQNELMKPSPIRYVQVLGALDYVLRIHKVDNLFRMQAFSQVFYYSNCIIFNKIISQSKFCTRSKAIQIRLNISSIEDWLRSHNLKLSKPENIGGIEKLVPAEVQLNNLLKVDKTNSDSISNPHFLAFYYNSLYSVGKTQLRPTIELLQWLQCMSSLVDDESLINTINQFDSLNYYQLHKVMYKLYKYEVDEPKIPRKLTNFVKSLINEQGSAQIERSYLHYMTQSTFLSKEIYIYINPNYVFDVALPNFTEGINTYGSGLGGVRVLRAKLYQPSLPIAIVDDLDDILTENKKANFNDTYDYDEQNGDEDEGDEPEDNEFEESNKNIGRIEDFKGDELFKQVQMPNSLAHKNWGGEDKLENFEDNPW
ncbi:hypothetical protein G9P44_001645 [Scheffersomyces stipitis]|nr:hypothetical protein G9P44_001645 [Scheffersomyces stipitis]